MKQTKKDLAMMACHYSKSAVDYGKDLYVALSKVNKEHLVPAGMAVTETMDSSYDPVFYTSVNVNGVPVFTAHNDSGVVTVTKYVPGDWEDSIFKIYRSLQKD